MRAAAVAAAVALVCAGSSELWHRANKVHTVCAEHGETFHLDHAVGGHNPADAVGSAPDVALGAQHEHCGLSPASSKRGVVSAHVYDVSTRGSSQAPMAAPIPHDRPIAIALYRTAPKASPPLAV